MSSDPKRSRLSADAGRYLAAAAVFLGAAGLTDVCVRALRAPEAARGLSDQAARPRERADGIAPSPNPELPRADDDPSAELAAGERGQPAVSPDRSGSARVLADDAADVPGDSRSPRAAWLIESLHKRELRGQIHWQFIASAQVDCYELDGVVADPLRPGSVMPEGAILEPDDVEDELRQLDRERSVGPLPGESERFQFVGWMHAGRPANHMTRYVRDIVGADFRLPATPEASLAWHIRAAGQPIDPSVLASRLAFLRDYERRRRALQVKILDRLTMMSAQPEAQRRANAVAFGLVDGRLVVIDRADSPELPRLIDRMLDVWTNAWDRLRQWMPDPRDDPRRRGR